MAEAVGENAAAAGITSIDNVIKILLQGGLNPYQFASNTFGWVDPWGLKCEVRTVNGTKIFGKGQRDRTPGHPLFAEVIANRLAMSGKFKEIHLNRQYTAIGIGSLRRPDVLAIDRNGRVHAIEMASITDMKGNRLSALTTRNQAVINALPASQRGTITVFDHPYDASTIHQTLTQITGGIP